MTITISETGIEIINDGADPGPLPALNGLETLRARVANEGGALTVAQAEGEFSTSVHFPTMTASPEESSLS